MARTSEHRAERDVRFFLPTAAHRRLRVLAAQLDAPASIVVARALAALEVQLTTEATARAAESATETLVPPVTISVVAQQPPPVSVTARAQSMPDPEPATTTTHYGTVDETAATPHDDSPVSADDILAEVERWEPSS